ncbi:MAG: UDP-N-acetylmuramate--L-alanine ligase [Clostridiales bacterium]|nr:UDP-N-acetylmuramate--L-alanine ligase [Clostridiales bacterium]
MRIHFVGINGVSMRALSELAETFGHTVTGSDANLSGHNEHNVDGANLVVYTNAVPQDNVELKRARFLGIPTIERATYLGEVAANYRDVIAVAGCHGKSTTAAMLGAAFSPLNPTLHVGAFGASHVGGRKFFITEACEYKGSFLHLKPDIAVILNIGYDHPDYYRDKSDVTKAFRNFASSAHTVIVNGDDEECKTFANCVTFGIGEGNTYRAVDIETNGGYRAFTLYVNGKRAVRVSLSIAGGHNVYNALASLAAADACKIPLYIAARNIGTFHGVPRRFERKGIAYNKSIFVDYAHHPDEIAATIRTAREIYPSVAVVFQPHTYSRTKALFGEFVDALSLADSVILAPIYSARELDDLGVSSEELAAAISSRGKRAQYCDSIFSSVESAKLLPEKALIFMGAGDINSGADMLLRRWASNK